MSRHRKPPVWPVKSAVIRNALTISREQDELTPEALDILLLMIDKIQSKFKYSDPADKEDCRSRAVLQVLMKWNGPYGYDPAKGDGFSWATQMIKNGLYAGWGELTKRRADFSTSSIFLDEI